MQFIFQTQKQQCSKKYLKTIKPARPKAEFYYLKIKHARVSSEHLMCFCLYFCENRFCVIDKICRFHRCP